MNWFEVYSLGKNELETDSYKLQVRSYKIQNTCYKPPSFNVCDLLKGTKFLVWIIIGEIFFSLFDVQHFIPIPPLGWCYSIDYRSF